jgi:hypothetical protein
VRQSAASTALAGRTPEPPADGSVGDNHLYLTRPPDPLDGEALPAVPQPPIDHAVTRRLARSTGEATAWKLHQAAQQHELEQHINAIGL